MMKFASFILVITALVTVGCNAVSGSRDSAMEHDSAAVSADERIVPVVLPDSALELNRYLVGNGAERVFYELKEELDYNLFFQDGGKAPQRLELVYDRYDNGHNMLEDGWPIPLYYNVSPDRQSLYVVSRMLANSDGWVTEYQLFKIDCKSLNIELLADCAAIEATDNGFTIAVARLTNEDTAQFTYQEIWMMHDEKLDWNGNNIGKSKKEYSYDQMIKRFAIDADGNHLVKGFQYHKEALEWGLE